MFWLKSRVLGVFLVAILVPGIVLGVFAFRSLKNDKELAERRLGERVQDVVERAKARIGEGWLRWNYELEAISRSSDPVSHARRLADRGVIVIADGGSVVLPAGSLLYNIGDSVLATENRTPAVFKTLEAEELLGKDPAGTIRKYRGLAKDSTDPDHRAWLLHLIGLTLLRLGRHEEALDTFEDLASLPSI